MRSRRTIGCAVAAVMLFPAAAGAVTVGGSVDAPSEGASTTCSGCVVMQVQPGPRAIPTDGVITSWRADIATAKAGYRLAIVVDQGAGTYRLDRLSPAQAPAATGVQTVPDRVPVKAGEYAALYIPASGALGLNMLTGGYLSGAVSTPGSTFTSGLATGLMLRYDATLEPDADGDGYGDVTQDACPSVTARQAAPCADAPTTPGPAAPAPAAPGPTSPAADTVVPRLENVVVSGGKVLFTSTESGSVVVRVTRLLPGRRRGRACVKPTAKLRRAPACTRRGPSSTSTATTAAGAGSATLNRSLLRKGTYEVSLVARDAAGNASPPVVRRLTIKR